MRLAVLVDPRPSEPTSPAVRGERILWLRDTLARLGFDVVALGDEPDAAQLERVLAGVEPSDSVLVHVSGQLATGGAVRVGLARAIGLDVVGKAVAARRPSSALYFVELTYEGTEDALRAAEHVGEIRGALDASTQGHAALLAVGARTQDRDPLAFTRLALRMAEELAAGEEEGVRLSDVVERMRALPESATIAQSYALVRGPTEFRLSPATPEKPELEPLVALSDGARENKKWDQALAGYRAAVLVAPTEGARAKIYACIGQVEQARGNTIKAQRAYERAYAACPADHASRDALLAMAVESEDWSRAIELSRERLAVLEAAAKAADAPGSAADRVDELFGIARMLGKLGDMPAAVTELEIARGIDPKNEDVLEALRRAYRVLSRWSKLLEVTGALADRAPSGAERAARLVAQARIAIEHLADEDRAVHFLEAALDDDPTHDEALDMLVEVRTLRGERARLQAFLQDLVGRYAELGDDERVRDVSRRLDDLIDAVDESDLMPDTDAAPEGAADAESETPSVEEEPPAETERPHLDAAAGQTPHLALVIIDPEAERAEIEPETRKVGAELLGQLQAALETQDEAHAAVERPEDSTQELEESRRDDVDPPEALEQMAARRPLDVQIHLRLFAHHMSVTDEGRAYLEALALEELGALEREHEELLEQCRPDGLRVRTTLDAQGWQELQAPGGDDVLDALFGALSRAAIAQYVDERRSRRKLAVLDPSRRLAESSTASIVRSFHWAAKVLDVPCPELYVLDTVYGDIAAVPSREPSTVLGPAVLRGLKTKDLAFLAGRHLTYYRPGYDVLLYFPTLPELTILLLAGVRVILPAMPMPKGVAPAVAALGAGLATRLTPEERAALTIAVHRLEARGGKVDLPAWSRCVELTAARAGLLLCGDLRTAMTRLRTETRAVADLTLEEKRADLVACCSSRALADLRSRVSVVASAPPPRSSGMMARADLVQSSEWTAASSQPG